MKVEVRRASQVHQMPHTGRAQSGPVIRPMVQQMTPTSAPATPRASHLRRAGGEIGDVGVEDDGEGGEHGDPAGKMEIKDALDGVHRLFIGRDEKSGVAREENQQGGDEFVRGKRAGLILVAWLPSFLHQIVAQKPGSRKEHNIKSGEECDPGAVERGLLGEERGGGFYRGDQERREDREQQQREQEFAHAGVGGDGGKNRAGDGEAEGAEREDEGEAADDARQGNVVEHRENRDEHEFGERHENEVGENFAEQDREAGDWSHAEGVEGFIGLLAGERTG